MLSLDVVESIVSLSFVLQTLSQVLLLCMSRLEFISPSTTGGSKKKKKKNKRVEQVRHHVTNVVADI